VSDFVFNVAKGAAVGMLRATFGTPPGLGWDVGVLALRNTTAVVDSTLVDLDTVAAVVAAYDEAAASGYARKSITNTAVQLANGNLAPDDAVDAAEMTLPSQTWTPAAGETWVKLVVFAKPTSGATDSNSVPLTAHDINVVTAGAAVTWTPSSGVYQGV
jgi:hypothetical protein